MNNKNGFAAYRAGFLLPLLLLIGSCKEGLDYQNNDAITPDNVWNDPTMTAAYLSGIYGKLMPAWPFNGGLSDEGFNGNGQNLGERQRGIYTLANSSIDLDYEYIDRINYFLDKLAHGVTGLSEPLKNQYAGEAKFWRAWVYWGMVRQVGGVPLILKVQDNSDLSKLFVPRNKTSECIAQIVKDLDEAAEALPAKYPNAAVDYGRITKVAALAVKGTVLLWHASPLFNPSNEPSRWQTAYDANKAARDAATDAGYGLYENFKNIWYKEQNKEVIMVNQFFYPGHPADFTYIRAGQYNYNQPYLPMLLGFPKKDGSPLQFDVNRQSDPDYNQQFLKDFYTNRDPRFYATVFFGGVPYMTADELADSYRKGETYWCVYRFNGSGDATNRTNYTSVLVSDFKRGGIAGIVGFYDRKGMDTTAAAADQNINRSQTDFPVIRYAEVLMNYGECANETGNKGEALEALYLIRKRAGITSGSSGTYGITANSKEEIRQAYQDERFIEFAFEGKRYNDLLRWQRFDKLNAMGTRNSIYIVLKENETVGPKDIILDAATRAKFYAAYIVNLDNDPAQKFNFDLNRRFSGISPGNISQSKNTLQQNIEWGGGFDPLQ